MKKYNSTTEYLIIGAENSLYRIESSDIVYIIAGGEVKKNYSRIVLANGDYFDVHMSLVKVKERIDEIFKKTKKDFRNIGSSVIINMVNLSIISTERVGFTNRRSDGFCTGYSAGYWDGKNNRPPKIDLVSNEISIPLKDLYKNPFEKFKAEIYSEFNIIK